MKDPARTWNGSEPVEEPGLGWVDVMVIDWPGGRRRVVLTQGRAFGYEQW
jgi:hypothetical protein